MQEQKKSFVKKMRIPRKRYIPLFTNWVTQSVKGENQAI